MKGRFTLSYALLFCGMLIGCQACAGEEPTQSLPVASLHSLSQCGVSEQGLRWVRQQQQLSELLATLRLPADKLTLDFAQHSLLVVYLGSQPNPGYQLQLLDEQAPLLADRLQVLVERLMPEPGMMYAQVITTPCLLLSLPNGDYQQIEAIDQFGDSLGVVDESP